MYININLFKKEWEALEKYYHKSHTRDEANLYYSKLKDLNDKDFLMIVDFAYKECRYFPNIAEFRELLKHRQEVQLKQWENIKKSNSEIDEETKKYLRSFFKRYCDTKEEYKEKLEKYGLGDLKNENM